MLIVVSGWPVSPHEFPERASKRCVDGPCLMQPGLSEVNVAGSSTMCVCTCACVWKGTGTAVMLWQTAAGQGLAQQNCDHDFAVSVPKRLIVSVETCMLSLQC